MISRMNYGWVLLTAGRIAALLAVAGIWQFASYKAWIRPIFFGDPIGIVSFLWNGLFVEQQLVFDLVWTLTATALAFGLGSILGIVVGGIFVRFPGLENFVSPFLSAINAVPRIALAPLFLLWFGLGIGSSVALGFSLTFFIVLSSTVAGGRSVNPDHLVLARTLGPSHSVKTFLKVTLPSAIPTVFSGLQLGLIYALLGVVSSEIIASQHGLGQSLSYLAGTFQTNGVFAILLLLAIVGGSITWAMTQIEKYLLRWK